jgi:hypothetical protein
VFFSCNCLLQLLEPVLFYTASVIIAFCLVYFSFNKDTFECTFLNQFKNHWWTWNSNTRIFTKKFSFRRFIGLLHITIIEKNLLIKCIFHNFYIFNANENKKQTSLWEGTHEENWSFVHQLHMQTVMRNCIQREISYTRVVLHGCECYTTKCHSWHTNAPSTHNAVLHIKHC